MNDWGRVSIHEVVGTSLAALGVGMLRFLQLIRRGRKFHWLDLILDPGLALFGGMLVWSMTEVIDTPNVMQGALVSLGAWGGARTIHKLERKYLGGTRFTDNQPGQ